MYKIEISLDGSNSYNTTSRHADTLLHRRIGNQFGVDPEVILKTSHGRRTIDVMKDFAPDQANWDCTA